MLIEREVARREGAPLHAPRCAARGANEQKTPEREREGEGEGEKVSERESAQSIVFVECVLIVRTPFAIPLD